MENTKSGANSKMSDACERSNAKASKQAKNSAEPKGAKNCKNCK